MTNLTGNHGSLFSRTTATGLALLLFLALLPACAARHMPDWSRVQAVPPKTKTDVQLYKDDAPQGSRKIDLSEPFFDSRSRPTPLPLTSKTVKRAPSRSRLVRKVPRPADRSGKRCTGTLVALGVTAAAHLEAVLLAVLRATI